MSGRLSPPRPAGPCLVVGAALAVISSLVASSASADGRSALDRAFPPSARLPLPEPVTARLVVDVDGDGRDDVVAAAAGQLVTLLQVQPDEWVPVETSLPPETGLPMTGDFDGDGVPDLLLFGWGYSDATVWLGDGIGRFEPTESVRLPYSRGGAWSSTWTATTATSS